MRHAFGQRTVNVAGRPVTDDLLELRSPGSRTGATGYDMLEHNLLRYPLLGKPAVAPYAVNPSENVEKWS